MTQRMELKEAEIVLSRWQTRRDGYAGESFEGLVNSIKRHGIINPLGVFVNENNEFELVYGHRRLMAARKAGRKTIPVDVIGSLSTGEIPTQLDKFQEMVLVDNLFHEDLTAVEVARGLQDLIDQQNITQEEAAKVVGKSQQWVSDKLALLKCGPEVQQAVTERAVEETVAKKLATLPEDVQGPVLERVKGHTSREAGPIIEQIKEALEPGFWDLPEDKPWSPRQINIKAMIDHCLEQVRTLTPDKMGEVLASLRASGNLKPPDRQASYFMSYFSKACGLGSQGLFEWQKVYDRTCETCLWAGEELHWECKEEDAEACDEYLGEDDPVRLPVPCGETDEDCQECQEDHGWCTDVSCYIEHVKKAQQDASSAVDEADLERIIEGQDRLRKFYDRQLQDVDGDHWLAQACVYCRQFRGPDQRDQCNAEKPQYVRVSFWQSDGVTVPRCSGFRLRDLSRIPEVDQSRFTEILLNWLEPQAHRMNWLLPSDEEELIPLLQENGLKSRQLVALVGYLSVDLNPYDAAGCVVHSPISGEATTWMKVEETEEATTPESG